MGLTCALYRATDAQLDRILEEPEELERFIDQVDGPALRVREVRPKGCLGLLLRLLPITITEVDPTAAGNETGTEPESDRTIDIEKAWHGLHFLFTGTGDQGEEPACYLLEGGEELDDEGNARALRPRQVREFAEYLSAQAPTELARRYDPARMAALKIYPEIWTQDASPGEDRLEWLLQSFAEVRSLTTKAAAAGDGMIIYIA